MDLYTIRQELLKGKSIFDLDLRVTYYTRVSTSSEEQINSLKNQTKYFNEFIQKCDNWQFVNGYIDEGLSGTSTHSRKAFNQMISDAKEGIFDLIITKEVSRFARNTLDSIFYTRELLKNNVGVYFQNDNINTLLPDSELRLTIMASMAQEESRKISERVKWGKKRAVEQGQLLITGRVYGYDAIDGKLVINKEEAKMVKLIFELYCKGYGFRRIGDILYNKGYTNEKGNKFGYSTLRRIISNPRYKGYYTANITTTVDFLTGKTVMNDRDDWIVYHAPDLCPPIVDEVTWDTVNLMLKRKREKTYLKHETSYQNKYKYSGKIYCKQHNCAFYRTKYRYKNSKDKEVWMCREYHLKGKKACDLPVLYTEEIDKILSIAFNTLFNDEENYYDKALSIVSKYIEETNYDNDIKKIIKENEKIKRKKDKLLDLVLNESITNKEFKSRNDEYNLIIENLNLQMGKYENMNDQKHDVKKQFIQMRKALKLEYNFDGYVNEETIDTFLEKIEVEKSEVENTLKFNIILKAGNEINALYSKNFNLSLIRHEDRDKMKLKFKRRKGYDYKNFKAKKYDIIVNINNISILLPVA